jgi:hypothetical protein
MFAACSSAPALIEVTALLKISQKKPNSKNEIFATTGYAFDGGRVGEMRAAACERAAEVTIRARWSPERGQCERLVEKGSDKIGAL